MTLSAVETPDIAPPIRTPSPRFHQLDGLRAVAAVMVMMRHSFTAGLREATLHSPVHFFTNLLHESAAAGVELFFVLSGVVLLRPYLRSGRKFEATMYVRRRLERLWPPFLAAWVLSGLVVLLEDAMPTWWTRRTNSVPLFSMRGWLVQLPILNFGWSNYNAAWWSLTVELLFYLSVILLIPLLIQRSRPKVACVALVLFSIPISLLLALRGIPHVPQPFIQLLRYGPCFALGVLLAAVDVPATLARIGLILGLVWACAATVHPALDIQLGWALFFAALIALSLSPTSKMGKALSIAPLVWLGERSYSLFLTHFAVFAAVSVLMSHWMPPGPAFWILSRIVEYTAAVLVAMLIFHMIEKRFARNLVTVNQILPPLRWTI
jgi:peptidoglycan/LPS O-acetylase OafA/YrhL